MKGFIFLLSALLGLAFSGFLALALWVWHIDRTWSPLIEPRLRERQQVGSVRVLAKDAAGKDRWIGSFTSGRMEERQPLNLSDVPPLLVQSIVVLEDPRFLSHDGFDIFGILRAMGANARRMRFAQGGSTITQQLVKNIFLSGEKKLKRKVTELILAALVEKRFTKDEILEAYMNEVYLGQLGSVEIHGVGRASEYYFGKKVGDLELPEMALLAAMIAGPGVYSPWRAPDKTRARRDRVLNALADAQLILAEELQSALRVPLPGPSNFLAPIRAAYMMDALREKLHQEQGEVTLLKGGFDLRLGLDLELQETAEKAVAEAATGWEPAQQAVLVAVDPRNCVIRTYVGGTDYRLTQLDRIRQSRRPIGSLMKPLEIAPLLGNDDQLSLASILEDRALDWTYDQGRGQWKPSNYDNKFRGNVTLRQALEESLNVPIVRVFFDRFPEGNLSQVLDPVRALGLDIPEDRALPSAVLGAIDQTPLATVGAFVKLVRQASGLAADAADLACRLGFEEVADDTELKTPLPPEQRFGQSGARLAIAALEGALRRGTSKALGDKLPLNQPWAGKTGTSSDKRDSWYAALSPELVVLGWVGRDDNLQTGMTGASGALPLVAKIVQRYALRTSPEAGWTWAESPNLFWRALRSKESCRPGNVLQQQVESTQPKLVSATPPPASFRFENHDYVMELFREGAEAPECR